MLFMYGLHLKLGRAKRQTYLIAFIDGASRLATHAQFSWEQNFTAVRAVFKEAILKRGVPKMIYTDNGKVYRSGGLAVICAGLGCTLLHTEPFTPAAKENDSYCTSFVGSVSYLIFALGQPFPQIFLG